MNSSDEVERLRLLHDAAVDSVLNTSSEFYNAVTTSDTRVMVLRDILQEERTQKHRLQEQVSKSHKKNKRKKK